MGFTDLALCSDCNILFEYFKDKETLEYVVVFRPLLIGEALYKVTGFNIGAPTINNTAAASSYVSDLLLI
ncbi:15 kDa selenoprotein [Corchorus olitorius]|uniref:15 kDa selenoprotein n=1 Tax=Corchorus olitorius TaxID=93759 RepID=A0A1R3IKJ7_9ROSI|nr:15 kDa selenoprotein [Corchorus olitorius]